MATSKEYLNFILEQLSDLENITYRAMMGEYILYDRGKIIAYLCDNRLLVKPVKAVLERMSEAVMEPPYEGAKPMVRVDEVDNKAFLTELFLAVYDQLPQPKKKK